MQSLTCLLEPSGHTHSLHVPGTSEVPPKLRLPVDSLIGYLRDRHGLRQEEGVEPVIRQFRHGQSNPTYYIAYGGEEMVLRKKPVRDGLCSKFSMYLIKKNVVVVFIKLI